MPDSDGIISRLCAACGLCCNGVLFYLVQLQPNDSPKTLSALGVRLKKKQGKPYLAQPCSAYRNHQCSIYEERPSRCRLFECRLCEQIRAHQILETDAMEQIAKAKAQVDRLHQILEQLGHHRTKQPLFKRCDNALAEPPDSPEIQAKHDEVKQMKMKLDSLLERRFRLPTNVSHLAR